MIREVIVKLNRSCNLRCSYCYYINDRTPELGARLNIDSLLNFIDGYSAYCQARNQSGTIVLHGGEPLLIGRKYIQTVLERISRHDSVLDCSIQTNGTLLDERWLELLHHYNANLGISIDGPQLVHDRQRPQVNGRSSYFKAAYGLKLAQRKGLKPGVLCVADPAADGKKVFAHLVELGANWMDFLLPYSEHVSAKHDRINHEGLSRFLVSAFLAWIEKDDPSIKVRIFEKAIRRQLGFDPMSDIKADPDIYIVLETSGVIARDTEFFDLDLRHGTRYYETSFVAQSLDFDELERDLLKNYGMMDGGQVPNGCRSCRAAHICRGGTIPSRFTGHDFNAPSVHCESMYTLSRVVMKCIDNVQQHKQVGLEELSTQREIPGPERRKNAYSS